jgi:hypothetical protein
MRRRIEGCANDRLCSAFPVSILDRRCSRALVNRGCQFAGKQRASKAPNDTRDLVILPAQIALRQVPAQPHHVLQNPFSEQGSEPFLMQSEGLRRLVLESARSKIHDDESCRVVAAAAQRMLRPVVKVRTHSKVNVPGKHHNPLVFGLPRINSPVGEPREEIFERERVLAHALQPSVGEVGHALGNGYEVQKKIKLRRNKKGARQKYDSNRSGRKLLKIAELSFHRCGCKAPHELLRVAPITAPGTRIQRDHFVCCPYDSLRGNLPNTPYKYKAHSMESLYGKKRRARWLILWRRS